MGGSITVLGDMLIAHYSGQAGEISDIRAKRERERVFRLGSNLFIIPSRAR